MAIRHKSFRLDSKSIELLKPRCQAFLGTRKVVFLYEGADVVWPEKSVVDVVLMGGAFALLNNEAPWQDGWPLRLWTLSRANHRVLTELCGFGENEIGVIPREALFTPPSTAPIDWSRPFSLVYSARLTHVKNPALSFSVAAALQRRASVDFKICGHAIDREVAAAIARKIKWKKKPQFLGDLGVQWTKALKGPAVLLDLSTSFEEDYGVSVAQAQGAGWPVILSRWGGHLEAGGLQVPLRLIRKNDPEDIADFVFMRKQSEFISSKPSKAPKIVTYGKIRETLKGLSDGRRAKWHALFADRPSEISGVDRRRIERIMTGLGESEHGKGKGKGR